MNRKDDTFILLADVQSIIDELNKSLRQAEQNSNLTSLPEIKIKQALEGLRSVLDYCAHDVHDFLNDVYKQKKMLPLKNTRYYFPITDAKIKFQSKMDGNFKKLDTLLPHIYDLFESVQLYKPGKDWLEKLVTYVNPMKHDKLLGTQVRRDSSELRSGSTEKGQPEFYIAADGVSTVISNWEITANGNTSKMLIDPVKAIDGRFLETKETIEKGYQIVYETSFTFKGSNDDILKLLRKIHKEVSRFTAKLYNVLQ